MPNNLDRQAMLAAGDILNECKDLDRDAVENLATKGVGVVLEQGLYAGLLFFYSRIGAKSPAEAHVTHLLKLARDVVGQSNPPPALQPLPNLEYLATSVCVNLHHTILVKTLWEQTLTYVRYGAKALKKADNPAASADSEDVHVAG